MKQNTFSGHRNKLIFNSLFILSLLLGATFLSAQSPADFSGTWILDNEKSDASFKEYKITSTIKQNPQTISIQETFLMQSGEKVTAPESSFTLDGKVSSKEEQGGVDRKFTKWSDDKKTLTITQTRTVDKNVYGSNTSYKLSDDGKVLTVRITDVNDSGMPVIIQIFNKK